MLVTVEFFGGLALLFLIGYLIAVALEKIFHIDLDNSKKYG